MNTSNVIFEIKDGVLVKYTGSSAEVIVPDEVEYIGLRSFHNCQDMVSCVIPSSVTGISIEYWTAPFRNCPNLKYIEIKGKLRISPETGKYDLVSDCPNFLYIVYQPDTPLSELPKAWKRYLAIGVIREKHEGRVTNDAAWEEARKYIRAQNKKLGFWRSAVEYPFVLDFMINEKILTEEMYDELVRLATEREDAETASRILIEKEKQYPSAEMFERLEKNAEKEFSKAEKLSDRQSVDYLKTQYAWEKTGDKEIMITSYKGEDSDIVIPAYIGHNKVTAIKDYAFSSLYKATARQSFFKDKFRSIVIPETVKEIGVNAFTGCRNLRSVVMKEGVEAIGDRSFIGCHELNEIRIPQSLKRIGVSAFTCTEWMENQGEYVVVNGCLIEWRGIGSRAVVPEGVKSINRMVFSMEYHKDLKEVVIPDTVTHIDPDCFVRSKSRVTIVCNKGSYADSYAKENRMKKTYMY